MIQISLESLKAGMKIGKAIFSEDGQLLLGKGVGLNDFFIQKLKKLGMASIYIKDDSTDDIEPHENISQIVRGSTIKHLREIFGSLEEINKEMKSESYAAVNDAISSPQFRDTFRNNPAFKKVVNDAGSIVDELMAGEVTLGLSSIKTYDNYTFQHSIDVAIVSIMIGRKIGLPQKRLREMGIGGLLHDIGKTFIPLEIVNKPGKLTEEEFMKIKVHPIIGYELIKDVSAIGVLPPHVAFQHHEKQDGSGYPRGLRGDNRLEISHERKMIHQYGSISAVADVYDALSSDRPYRKAMPPEKVISIMREMDGKHLNHAVLRCFLEITPVYPVGSTIRVTKGKNLNHLGIVAGLNPGNLDRPIIRLVYNQRREKIDVIDINLLEDKDTDIMSIIL